MWFWVVSSVQQLIGLGKWMQLHKVKISCEKEANAYESIHWQLPLWRELGRSPAGSWVEPRLPLTISAGATEVFRAITERQPHWVWRGVGGVCKKCRFLWMFVFCRFLQHGKTPDNFPPFCKGEDFHALKKQSVCSAYTPNDNKEKAALEKAAALPLGWHSPLWVQFLSGSSCTSVQREEGQKGASLT